MTPLTGVRLAFFLGGPLLRPAPSEFARAIEAVEVMQGETPTGRDAFSITLGVGRAGGGVEYDLLSSGLLDVHQRISATALVGTTLIGLLNGVILDHQFIPGDAAGGAKLVVTGEDATVLMDFDEKNRTFPNLRDDLIAVKVAGGYVKHGFAPLVPRLPANLPPPIETLVNRVPTQTETDFALLHRLARRNGCVFYAEPTPVPGTGTLTWAPEVRGPNAQAALTTNFSIGTTVRCLRFHLDALAPRGLTLPGTDEQLGGGDLSGRLPGVGRLARSPVPVGRTQTARAAAKLSAARSQALVTAARAASPDALVAEGELNVVLYGKPLAARRVVGLRGVGPAHSGEYFVRQVVHRFRPRTGEYLQRFTMVREGRGAVLPVVRTSTVPGV